MERTPSSSAALERSVFILWEAMIVAYLRRRNVDIEEVALVQ